MKFLVVMVSILFSFTARSESPSYFPLLCEFNSPDFSGAMRMDGVGKFSIELQFQNAKYICQLESRLLNQEGEGLPMVSVKFRPEPTCSPSLPEASKSKIDRNVELMISKNDLKLFVVDRERPVDCTKRRFEKLEIQNALQHHFRMKKVELP